MRSKPKSSPTPVRIRILEWSVEHDVPGRRMRDRRPVPIRRRNEVQALDYGSTHRKSDGFGTTRALYDGHGRYLRGLAQYD
jgi:hypothetical protein